MSEIAKRRPNWGKKEWIEFAELQRKDIERLTADFRDSQNKVHELMAANERGSAEVSGMQDAWFEFRDSIECGQLPTEMKYAVIKELDSFETMAILEIRKAQDTPEKGQDHG